VLNYQPLIRIKYVYVTEITMNLLLNIGIGILYQPKFYFIKNAKSMNSIFMINIEKDAKHHIPLKGWNLQPELKKIKI